jgi:acyl dehydratase
MTQQNKADFYTIAVGFEFPSKTYALDSALVMAYLQAVKESHALYSVHNLAPPLAIAAYAMTALAESSTFPAGTVHVTQELDFLKEVQVGETITCRSKVTRRLDRAGMRIMTTEIQVFNREEQKVLAARVGFVLPAPGVAK